MIEFVRKSRTVGSIGKGRHRSGWPFVIDHLLKVEKDFGVVVDDFADYSFYPERDIIHDYPWVGIFHHPLYPPQWAKVKYLGMSHLFETSLPTLRGCVAFSQYLADQLQNEYGIESEVLYHPTELSVPQWNPEAFIENQNRTAYQIGYFLKNTRAIYQLNTSSDWRKVHVWQREYWVDAFHQRCEQREKETDRRQCGQTEVIDRLPNDQYDEELSRNVVFVELIDSSANNTIIECIARGTPIILNRHPAAEEYLGADYPLFYDRFEDAGDLFEEDMILAGHRYLAKLDKSELSIDQFIDRFVEVLDRTEEPPSIPTIIDRSETIPIGIITRNRPVYLDATIKSLLATDLPADIDITIFDDHSDSEDARRFLGTADHFRIEHEWPQSQEWLDEGLCAGLQDDPIVEGIAGRLKVRTIDHEASVGVGRASAAAILEMFGRHPRARAVILLQDDIVFRYDWYRLMIDRIGESYRPGWHQGIVSGFHLDYRDRDNPKWPWTARMTAAQCMLIRRELFTTIRSWLMRPDHPGKNWDMRLCDKAFGAKYELHLRYPYVVQHIGYESLVRPNVISETRIGYGSKGPYCFSSLTEEESHHGDYRQSHDHRLHVCTA